MVIFILAFLGFVAVLLLFMYSLCYGMIAFLFIRPIIDMTWDQNIFWGFSLLHITGIIPLFILIYVIITGRVRTDFLRQNILYISLICFLGYVLLHLLYIGAYGRMITGLDAFMRLTNTISGLILFPLAFHKEKHYKWFLNVIIISSIIPLSILLLQAFGLVELRYQTSVGNIRYEGFYNGPVNLRYFFSFALLAVIAKMICYRKVSVLGLIIGSFMFIGITLTYSKAGTLFILILPLVFMTLKKKARILLPLLILFSIPIIWIQSSGYFNNVFIKEIGALEKDIDVEYALQGRILIWQIFWDNFSNDSFTHQMLGSFSAGKVGFGGGIHNDFLLNLCRYGYVGLLLYSLLVFTMLKAAFLDFQKWIGQTAMLDSAIFIARALTALWLIDSIGLHPSMYPSLMLIVFGIFGLVFSEIHKLKETVPGYIIQRDYESSLEFLI